MNPALKVGFHERERDMANVTRRGGRVGTVRNLPPSRAKANLKRDQPKRAEDGPP